MKLVTALMLLICSALAMAQNGEIRGMVRDADTGEVLPNANVTVQDTALGAAADVNGRFVISGLPGDSVMITVSYLGHEPSQLVVTLPASSPLEVKLIKSFLQMEQVVVTATRSEKLLENVPVVTEIVQRAEIEEKGAENLSEILQDRAGIAVETGSSGGAFFYMNGIDSKRILLLVDGVPLAGKINNRNPLDLIDSDKIDRIELVKGPGSALYGSEAMGGVVNVITRGFSERFTVRFSGRIGTDDLYSGNLALSGGLKGLNYALDIDRSSRGFNQASAEIKMISGTADRLQAGLGYKHAALGRFEIQAEYRRDDQDSESLFMGRTSENLAVNKNLNGRMLWTKKLTPFAEVRLNTFAADNNRTYRTLAVGSTRPAAVDTTIESLSGFRSEMSLSPAKNWKADFGLDYTVNDYSNQRLSGDQSRRQAGLFTQVEATVKSLTLVAGGRYDKITEVDGRFSPRVSGMYAVTPDLKLRASWGGGFRAPSFIELYSDFAMPIPGMPLRVFGNPDLRPETSYGGNVSIEYRWSERRLINLTLFQNKFEDMIVDYQKDRLTFSYLNARNATFQGLEVQSKFSVLHNLNATVSYNFTDIVQEKEDAAISKIAPHSGVIRLTYGLFANRLQFSLRSQMFSRRQILVVSRSGDFEKVKKNGYALVDLTASYRVTPKLSVRLGGLNLTDYTDDHYGPFLGRQSFVGLAAEI